MPPDTVRTRNRSPIGGGSFAATCTRKRPGRDFRKFTAPWVLIAFSKESEPVRNASILLPATQLKDVRSNKISATITKRTAVPQCPRMMYRYKPQDAKISRMENETQRLIPG